MKKRIATISEIIEEPLSYFDELLTAVTSRENVVGYMVGAELFHSMLEQIERSSNYVEGNFHPSPERLREIAKKGAQLLDNMSEDDLTDFEEG